MAGRRKSVSKGRRLEGYAATFGKSADIGGRFTETIAPGLSPALFRSRNDILALVDHDPAGFSPAPAPARCAFPKIVAASPSIWIFPDTQAGRDVLALAERGDLGGMSFGFTALDEKRDGNRRETFAPSSFMRFPWCWHGLPMTAR